jgi:Flp pilus assembly protein TadD
MAAAAGEHRAAIEHLRAAVAADTKRNTARERLVAALLHMGEVASAEAEAHLALDLAPNDVALLNMLGVIQKRRGRFTEAMDTFRKGIALEPLNHSPWYNLGNTHLTIGEFAQAAEALKRASELKKDSETTRLYGQALIGMGEHDMGMAIFARAQQLDPKNSRVYTSRAIALQRIGAPDAEVLTQIDQAIALEPNNVEHMRSKAAYFQRRSRFAEAEAVHKELLARIRTTWKPCCALAICSAIRCAGMKRRTVFFSVTRWIEAGRSPLPVRSFAGSADSRYGVDRTTSEAGKVAHQLVATGTDLKPHAANLSGVFLRLADYAGLDASATGRN